MEKRNPNYTKAKAAAEKLLKAYDIDSDRYLVPVLTMAQWEWLDVHFVDFSRSEDITIRNASWFLMRNDKTIWINKRDSHRRQRFTIAHELGHYLLHKDAEEEILYRRTWLITKDPKEKEANYFAASLLVPEVKLKEIITKSPELAKLPAQLSSFFGVSLEMMLFRLRMVQNDG